MLSELNAELDRLANPEKARFLQKFFKTGKGEYAEGDVFLGITVPELRRLARRFRGLSLDDARELFGSPYHEARLTALIILVEQFRKADMSGREHIFRLYMSRRRRINNWDLVDLSAPYIVGPHLEDRPRVMLDRLAISHYLWDRRIAMLATFHFIRKGDAEDALRIAEILAGDQHDLIHKAVGWMLREVGKRCGEEIECEFLERHCRTMPRTMLRYAIERFPAARRAWFLNPAGSPERT